MKTNMLLKIIAAGAFMALPVMTQASLIAYYSFDNPSNGGQATVGTDATLTGAAISTTVSAVGAGSLYLSPTMNDGILSGAVSGNNFVWTNDTRSINFWMKADAVQPDTYPTMISLGSSNGVNGTRFDIRLDATASNHLRLEVQGGGTTTGVAVGNGSWYNVTVALGDPATVGSCQYFVYDSGANLVGSGNFSGAQAIATGTGPLHMGNSLWYTDTREFSGYLDEVRLYDNQLTQSDALALAQDWNPVVVPEPSALALAGLGLVGLLAGRRWKKA